MSLFRRLSVTLCALAVSAGEHALAQHHAFMSAGAASRTDPFSDPLPPHATMRVGTGRLRQGGLVHTLRFSPDGVYLSSASALGSLHLWEAASGRLVCDFATLPACGWCLAFSPDSSTLAVPVHPPLATRNRDADTWDFTVNLHAIPSGKVLRTLTGGKGPTRQVLFSPDGKLLATLHGRTELRLWDVATGKCLRSFPSECVEAL